MLFDNLKNADAVDGAQDTAAATITDVAKEAGVSVAAVSRYMNHGPVGKENRAKIARVVEKLDYHPNIFARALSAKSSKIIGFIVPSISNTFFTELYETVDELMDALGYGVVLCNANSIRKEQEFLDMLVGIRANGIITATGHCGDIYASFHKTRMPVICVDRKIEGVPFFVSSDNHKGGIVAANHLYAGGCRKVAFIGAHCESESQHYRRKGFLNRCKELCIEADVYLTRDEDAKGEIDSLYEKLRQYQGLFAWNDSVAIELLHIFARNGCRIPQDIQMIGFDNTYIGSLFLPALTTIAQNIPEIAAKTVECFAETQAGKTDSRNVFVDVQLIQRATTIGEHRAT